MKNISGKIYLMLGFSLSRDFRCYWIGAYGKSEWTRGNTDQLRNYAYMSVPFLWSQVCLYGCPPKEKGSGSFYVAGRLWDCFIPPVPFDRRGSDKHCGGWNLNWYNTSNYLYSGISGIKRNLHSWTVLGITSSVLGII